jgi:PAS domain S-box-containing protein
LWNARAETIFGLRAAYWRGYRQAITLGHAKTGGQALVTRATHKHGNKLYVELAFEIIRDSQHNTLGAVATGRDITQRYLAERAQCAR